MNRLTRILMWLFPPPPYWSDPHRVTPRERAEWDTPGPGTFCDTCGHFAYRHNTYGCHFLGRVDGMACTCRVMLWDGTEWPRPWLPAPAGLRVEDPA